MQDYLFFKIATDNYQWMECLVKLKPFPNTLITLGLV